MVGLGKQLSRSATWEEAATEAAAIFGNEQRLAHEIGPGVRGAVIVRAQARARSSQAMDQVQRGCTHASVYEVRHRFHVRFCQQAQLGCAQFGVRLLLRSSEVVAMGAPGVQQLVHDCPVHFGRAKHDDTPGDRESGVDIRDSHGSGLWKHFEPGVVAQEDV
jgi:hypothetical protein